MERERVSAGGNKGNYEEREDPSLSRYEYGNSETADYGVAYTKLKKELFRGYIEVLEPVSKEFAYGHVGDGSMLDWAELVGILKLECCCV